ncbi:MAG: zinc ribbon domain-containing protein [Fusobacterium sp.]|nr:zinc ribbon domain-containing protein [Fusobacterium sp.]
MWCIECGNKLAEGAKFCMNCGTKIMREDENLSENNLKSKDIKVKTKNINFSLFGFNMEVPKEMKEYVDIRNIFEKQARETSNNFMNSYYNYGDIVNFLSKAKDDIYECYRVSCSKAIDILHDKGIYSFDLQKFYEEGFVPNVKEWLEEYNKVYSEYKDIMEYGEAQKNYRAMRKEGRGKMVGGGFGLGGALKGAAMAGSINAVTGIFHSIGNGIGNSLTNAEIKEKLNNLFRQKNLKEIFTNASYNDTFNIHYLLIIILNDVRENQIPVIYDEDNFNMALTMFNNITEGKVKEELKAKVFSDMLFKYPFDEDFYYLALDEFGDENGELEKYGNFFGINVTEMKEEIEREKNALNKLDEITSGKGEEFEEALEDNYFFEELKEEIGNDVIKNITLASSYTETNYNKVDLYFLFEELNNKVEKKLENAKSSYAQFEKDEKLILLSDSTAFGSGKTGFIITNRFMYGKGAFEKPWKISFQNINNLEIKDKNTLILNEYELKFYAANKESIVEVFSLLQFILMNLKYIVQ